MIIEVALGVVLGVLILRYWPVILALGALAIVSSVIVLIGGTAIYWIVTNEPVFRKLLTLVSLLAAFLIGLLVARIISKRTVLEEGEAGVFLAITFFLVTATLFFDPFITKWSNDAEEPFLFLFLLPLAGLWVWIWFKVSRLIRQRQHETPVIKNAA